MSKQKTIKEVYADALFWAMSPKSKGNTYHLTRVEESVLRKLIRYDKTSPRIDYTNDWIAKHTFLDESQIEKVIPKLDKKGFIKTIHFTLKNDEGQKIKRRIINIKWDFIEFVLSCVPKSDLREETSMNEKESIITDGIDSVSIMESKETGPITQTQKAIDGPSVNEEVMITKQQAPKPIQEIKKEVDVKMLDIVENVIRYKDFYQLIIKNINSGTRYQFIPVKIKQEDSSITNDEAMLLPTGKKYALKSLLLKIEPTLFDKVY